jgi:hypothetical protein
LKSIAVLFAGGAAIGGLGSSGEPSFRIAPFSADVTPPLGHPLMGGGILPAARIDDALSARGFVLLGAGMPLALVAVDWCEIRNEAHDRWRVAVAEAAGTDRERVLVACVHQHDAPVADTEAQRILATKKATGNICDLEFHEAAVRRVASVVREAMKSPQRISLIGTGQAKVEGVASNRRFLGADGKAAFSRTSSTRDPRAHEEPEGTIDPWLKTLSFWDGDKPVLALSAYATHPMSYYGKGGVSSDFVGLARRRREEDLRGVAQVYLSGASGNVTAGKYNDGSPENRPLLAERIQRAMTLAWESTRRQPIQEVSFRSVPLRLEPRGSPGFTVEDLDRRLKTDTKPFGQCLAALGLSWRERADAGYRIDVPVLGFGSAQLLLLPGESYVEYQLFAQRARPDSFVVVAGYGECATGYIPTDKAFEEGDTNLSDWCWVAPGSERAMKAAIEAALKGR